MIGFLVTGMIAGLILLVGEFLRRRLGYSNEEARKLIHIVHGLCVGVWPFFLGYWIVYVVEALFVISVLAAYRLHWFGWLWKVGRISWGEYFYPLGIVGAALIANSKWVFLASVLELAVADAAAALVGKKLGKRNTYFVFGQVKSVAGSMAFFVTSILILGTALLYSPLGASAIGWPAIISLALILTFTENVGVYGLDNLLLPLVSVAFMSMLTQAVL